MPKVLKPFLFQGAVVHPGDRINTGAVHHQQLAQRGLVEAPAAPKAAKGKAKAKAKPAAPERRTKIIGD